MEAGRRRRSNRPGNSQANGPRDWFTSGKSPPDQQPGGSADGIILSGTATDGVSTVFREFSLLTARAPDGDARFRSADPAKNTPARPPPGTGWQDGCVCRL